MRVFLFLVLLSAFAGCTKKPDDIPYTKIILPQNLNATTFRDIHIFSPSNYIISGGNNGSGVVLKTTDGGLSWNEAATFDNPVNSMHFLNNDTGFCADSDVIIYKTTDGGLSWSGYYGSSWPLSVNRNLRDIYFVNDSTGLICGGKNFGNGVLYRTENAGDSWAFSEYVHEYRGICFRDELHGLMCGYGSLLSTTDGGATFADIPYGNNFYTGICTDQNNNYWMCDYNGNVYMSATSGTDWTKMHDASGDPGNKFRLNCIAVSPSGKIACAGNGGFITWSNDNGNTWDSSTSFGGNEILKINWISNVEIIAAGHSGVYRITIQ